jgi:methionyl-tRNA formyltransferase
MKFIYFGTPEFAASILEHLIDQGFLPSAIVTQPDRPKGRSLLLSPSPVKELSLKRIGQVPIFQPEKASHPPFLEQLRVMGADLYVVVVYGQILSSRLLDLPPLGSINVHPSLLPKYRGPSPIRAPLFAGEEETGVTIMKLIREMDAGDIVAQKKVSIPPEMVFGELEDHLLAVSKDLLVQVIGEYQTGIPYGTPQDHSKATFTKKLTPEETRIDWKRSAYQIHCQVRALCPKPGAWAEFESRSGLKRIKILRTREGEGTSWPCVACGDGSLELLQVQPEGKKAMSGSEFFRGVDEKFRLL